jgi:hypothetical protein
MSNHRSYAESYTRQSSLARKYGAVEMKSIDTLDYQSGGLLGDLSVGGELTVIALVAIAFFIIGALFGRLSVVRETPAGISGTAPQAVYGRFGRGLETREIAAPAALSKVR